MHVLFILTVSGSHSNYTSWNWNLNEMHVLFTDICMTVSDYHTNPTVIILVGIGILFYLFISA